jgi:cytochrome c55X
MPATATSPQPNPRNAAAHRSAPPGSAILNRVAGLAAGMGCVLLLAAGLAQAKSDPAKPDPAKIPEIGQARADELSYLVRQDCGSCHGMTLKGGLGKPLLPKDLEGLDAATLAGIILDGIPGTPMPPWQGQLSDAEARWIARALKNGEIK